jgi:signal peptidase II
MADLRLKAYSLAAAVCALDRITKLAVEAHIGFYDTIKVIPGFFDLVHSQNRGVAFGLFNDSPSPLRAVLLAGLSLAAVIAIAVLLWRPAKLDRRTLWGFACILGGAAGNLYDRALYGRVTDFLELYLGEFHWPTFNVADSAIVIGSCLLLLDIVIPKRRPAQA